MAASLKPHISEAWGIVMLIFFVSFIAVIVVYLWWAYRRKSIILLSRICPRYNRDTDPVGFWMTFAAYGLLIVVLAWVLCLGISTFMKGNRVDNSWHPHRLSLFDAKPACIQ